MVIRAMSDQTRALKQKKPTITDVAREAGASLGTVSAVLNGSPKVSDRMTTRIRAAIDKVGYQHNSLAASLRSGSTRIVGIIVADISNPFFTDIIAALQPKFQAEGLALMIGCGPKDGGAQSETLNLLLSRQIDALVVVPSGDDDDLRDLLKSVSVPMVLLDRKIDGVSADTVTLDNAEAAGELTRHVIAMGHKRIAHVAGPETTLTGRDRRKGWEMVMAQASLSTEGACAVGSFDAEGGRRATERLLANAARPTCIIASNNLMAIGVMQAIAAADLLCPADISVCCIDDFAWADAFKPRMTVMAQPVIPMVDAVFDAIMVRLRKSGEPQRSIVLKGQFRPRDSILDIRRTP